MVRIDTSAVQKSKTFSHFLLPTSLFVIGLGEKPFIVEVPIGKDFLEEKVRSYDKMVTDPDSDARALKKLSKELHAILKKLVETC